MNSTLSMKIKGVFDW